MYKLHEEERNSQREQRIHDMRDNGLSYLSSDDVRTANAWLRDRFAIYVEARRVTKIIPLF